MSVKSNSFDLPKNYFQQMMSKINFGCNLGSLEVDNNYQDTETYKSVKWVMEITQVN